MPPFSSLSTYTLITLSYKISDMLNLGWIKATTSTVSRTVKKKVPNITVTIGYISTSINPKNIQYMINLIYSLSNLVPITWKVIYAGIITATIAKMSGEKSTNIDNNSSNENTRITNMEGLSVVFYCRGLSCGQESIWSNCKYVATCLSFSIYIIGPFSMVFN